MRNPHGKHAGDFDADYDKAARYKAARRAHTDTHPLVGYATYCTPNCASNCPGHFTDDGGHIAVTLTNNHAVPAVDPWWIHRHDRGADKWLDGQNRPDS